MRLDTASGSTSEMRKPNLSQRALDEVKKFWVMLLYLFLLFALLNIHKSIILAEHQIPFSDYGFALVNALILAKVMLVAENLHLGSRFEGSPLVYPILFKSIVFAIVLICFHILENVVVGMWHGMTMMQSIPGVGGGGLKGVFSAGAIMAVALIPFFAFREISRVVGASKLVSLVFTRGPGDVIVEFRLRPLEHR